MAIGTITKELYLSSMPENCAFTVISFEIKEQKDWYAKLEGNSGKQAPYEVTPIENEKGGMIARSKLSTKYAFVSGTGASCKLYFTVSCDMNGETISKKGYFKFTTTDWPKIGRPAYYIGLFGFERESVKELKGKTPFLSKSDPYYMSIAVKDNHMYMIASTQNNLSTQIVSAVLNGVITAPTKTFNWAICLIS